MALLEDGRSLRCVCIGLNFKEMEIRCYDGINMKFFILRVMEFRAGQDIDLVDPVRFA